MGRFEKTVITDSGLDRRELGYYSTPSFISEFLAEKSLEINPNGTYALDPCVGHEEMIEPFRGSSIIIDGMDVHEHCEYSLCNFTQNNFIEYYRENKLSKIMGQDINMKYDYYLANPPYNCHELDYIKCNKKALNQLFGSVGSHNMYSMFISAMIDCAKEGAVISFISSDSFLTARSHKSLREQILSTCSVHYLLLCPVDLFRQQKADVRTCIMILQKGKSFQKEVKILDREGNKRNFENSIRKGGFIEAAIDTIVKKDGSQENQFMIGVSNEIQQLFLYPALGDVYKCITGVSTGDDLRFLSKEKKPGFSIPFYKNPGSKKFFCEPDAYLTDDYLKYDADIKNFMVRNKGYMLKEGITCSSMGLPFGACYLPQNSTFGVNANVFCNQADIWWLLGYLNSSLVTYIVRGVLIRSNMITSGYVSQIPVIHMKDTTKQKLAQISRTAFEHKGNSSNSIEAISLIDTLVFGELSLSENTKNDIISFSKNLSSKV